MMHTTLGWGVIGCGDVFENKSGPAIQTAERSRLVTIMRRDPAALERIAAGFPPLRTTTEAEAVIADPEVDIVYIATPPAAHARFVHLAAAAGKAVLVEKPLGLTAAESQSMVAACAAAGVPCFASYFRRFWPHVEAIATAIEDGSIGRPLQAFIDLAQGADTMAGGWRVDPAVSGGGYFADIGSHRLDIWVRLFGEPHTIQAVASSEGENGTEGTVSLVAGFDGGIQGLARADFLSGRSRDRFEIIGSEGSIVADPFDGHAFALQRGDHREEFSFERLAAPHLGLIWHIEAVLLDGVANRAPGNDGVVTDRILDAVLARNG